MLAPRQRDEPPHQAAAEEALATTLFAAITDALGVLERDRLLGHLSRCWHEVTCAERVILAVESGPAWCYAAAVSDSAGASTCSRYRLPEETSLIDGLAEEVLAGGSAFAGPDANEEEGKETGKTLVAGTLLTKTLVSPKVGRPIGGMVLVGATPLPDELDRRFIAATAALLERAVSNDRWLRDAKLESLGEFAGGAGHEINNPLAAISGRAQLLLRDETDPERRRHLTTIGAQALRIRDMIGDTMLFARPPVPEPRLLNLPEVLDAVLEKFAGDFESRGLIVQREYAGGDVPIWADETQLCVVISELVRNAVEASPARGTIRVVAARETASGGGWVRFGVRDEGDGLSAEAAEHLFDPFYSGRQAGRGLGFGLSKCWRIVTNHGGRIDVEGGLDQGFGMLIHWPTRDGISDPSASLR